MQSHLMNFGTSHTKEQGAGGRVINVIRPGNRTSVVVQAATETKPAESRGSASPPRHRKPQLSRDSAHLFRGNSPQADAERTTTELWEALQPVVEGDRITFGFDKNLEERFVLGEEVGKGGFGRVVKCLDKESNIEYACKIIPKIYVPKPGDTAGPDRQEKHITSIRNEVTALMRLRGTLNVVYLEGAFEDDSNVYLVTEMCKGGELWHRINERHYSERTVASFMRAVLRTLAQCHSHNLLHRDIKPGNFMLLDGGDAAPLKAIDFGLAVPFKDSELPMENLGFDGTPWFMAPEMLRSEVTPAADVWAAGIMAHQLLTGKFPFDDRRSPSNPALSAVWRSILCDDLDLNRPYFSGISDQAKDFIKFLLAKEMKDRPSAKEALKHPWLQGDVTSRSEGKPISRSVVQRIQRYAQGSVFKRTVLQSMAEELLASRLTVSDASVRAGGAQDVPHPRSPGGSYHGPLLFGTPLKNLLARFDYDEDESKTAGELADKFKEMGYRLEPSEVERLTDVLDPHDSGAVDRAAFVASVVDWKELQENHREEWLQLLRRSFNELDRDGDGTLWVDDLIHRLQDSLPPSEVRAAVEQAMTESGADVATGQMSFDQFVRLVRVNSLDSLDSLDMYDDRWGKSRNNTIHGSIHGSSHGGAHAALDALRALSAAVEGSQRAAGNFNRPKLETVRERD